MAEKPKQDPCEDKQSRDALFGLFERYVEQKRKDRDSSGEKAGRIREVKNGPTH